MLVETLMRNAACPDARIRRLRSALLCLALAGIGTVVGFTAARLSGDSHTAGTESVTGTVTWSNEQTGLIAFEADGTVRDPLDGDTIYSVLGDGWQDATGTLHSGEHPRCLAGEEDRPVSTDRHRVRLEVLHRDTGGRRPQHIAVHVHCLD